MKANGAKEARELKGAYGVKHKASEKIDMKWYFVSKRYLSPNMRCKLAIKVVEKDAYVKFHIVAL